MASREEAYRQQTDDAYRAIGRFTVAFSRLCLVMRSHIAHVVDQYRPPQDVLGLKIRVRALTTRAE